MRPLFHRLLLVYFLLVVGKLLLASFIGTPTIFADEYIYAKNARSIFTEGSLHTHGDPTLSYPPLYPAVLSFSYAFGDMGIVYFVMKLLNALFVTLTFFPIFYLARDFVSERRAFFMAILINLLPPLAVTPAYIMSENLFYPLFIFFLAFLYRSFTTDAFRYPLLAGLCAGFLVLTKALGIVAFAILGCCLVRDLFLKNYPLFRRHLVSGVIGGLIASFLVFRNLLLEQTFTGSYGHLIAPEAFSRLLPHTVLIWIFLYLGYLLLAGGILPFFYARWRHPSPHFAHLRFLVIVASLSALALAVYYSARQPGVRAETLFPWLTGRMIGRYVEYILPLLVLFTSLPLFSSQRAPLLRWKLFVSVVLLAVATQLLFFSPFPYTNMSLSLFGFIFVAARAVISSSPVILSLLFAIIFVGLAFLCAFLVRRFSLPALSTILLVFVLFNSSAAYAMTFYNANFLWGSSEQVQLGKWVNENIREPSTFLVDVDYCTAKDLKRTEDALCSAPEGKFVKAGFWINHDILVGTLDDHLQNAGYLLTRKQLSYPLVYSTSSSIFLYDVFSSAPQLL